MHNKMSNKVFIPLVLGVAVLFSLLSVVVPNDYFFSAAYTVLLFIILSIAWNILGGYTGYVNFGTAAFFAIENGSNVFNSGRILIRQSCFEFTLPFSDNKSL